ncbi:MAG: DUF5916 domain-containing protein [Candidatus Latescibacterota bacterium]
MPALAATPAAGQTTRDPMDTEVEPALSKSRDLPADSSLVPAPTKTAVTAVFVEDAPKIDGHLDEEIWRWIEPITQFYQVWPDDGAEPTERSEARVAYDRDNLYFAFKFYDRHPDLIRAKNFERGGRNSRDDHAYIGLDTYQDGRNAYLFEMNALGTQDDATVTDEGLSWESFSWDAVFISETIIDDEGWSMEVSIPFRQIRFPKGEELEFGLMLSRMINRKNERVIWPHIGLEFGGSSFGSLSVVSQYGTLKGLNDIRRGKNIEIKPYITTGAQEFRNDLADTRTESDFKTELGVDVKYGVSSNVTLDLTVNTDFAQVEADNVQLNLTRFSLFFPEKREFFLERAGLFEHGNLRSSQTFFSRRIGLTEQILAGARLTGQAGKFSFGFLNIEEGEKMADVFGANSKNNTVARVRASVFPRGAVGAILTNLHEEERFNRVLGFDAQYRFWSSSEFTTWFTNVWDTNPELNNQQAGHVLLRLQNNLYGATASFNSIGAHYQPELGFVRRLNMREYALEGLYRPTLNLTSIPLRRLNFYAIGDYIEGQDGEKQTVTGSFSVEAEAYTRDRIEFAADHSFERLTEPFAIRPDATIPKGDYTFSRFSLEGSTDDSRNVFGSASAQVGGFFEGNRIDLGTGIGWRQSRHLTIEGKVDYSKVDLPIENGRFNAMTGSMSILGAVNRKLFAKALIQYDNFTRNVTANIRLDWIHTPGSDLFLVFNTSYHVAEEGNEHLFDPHRGVILNSQAAIAKLTYLVLL